MVILGALTTPAGSSRRAADWLRAQDEHTLAVGHEPLISGVVAYLVGESELPALFPAQILAIRDGRVIGASPAVKSPAGAPSSRGAPPSRG